jgi:hypothetical protein
MGTLARSPVLIGAAQFAWKGGAEGAPTPLDLVTRVARRAAAEEATLRGMEAAEQIGRRGVMSRAEDGQKHALRRNLFVPE